jgi:hypothetical protein
MIKWLLLKTILSVITRTLSHLVIIYFSFTKLSQGCCNEGAPISYLFIFGGYWGFELVALCFLASALPLNHTLSPLCFSYFSYRILCILPRPALDSDLPNSTSQVAGIISMYHHIWLLWDEGLANFLPGLTLNCDLPISASQVAGNIGVHHCACPLLLSIQIVVCWSISLQSCRIIDVSGLW